MNPSTASHQLLGVLERAGIDRVFLVPGESYLAVLDALYDFPQLDVVTCRHEAGAGFMAIADGRLTLGTWQGIFLFEHRRAEHNRQLDVVVMGI